ncbi:hypothetical protein J2Z37_004381 [Ammoniphilus resinae]|uniref:Uncharacterized protein n=1 Tax=Ammoniphilus resinae TaxID=861532 RepID=A0ABS4GVS9_9BACL|nr:hypothetical protein [Ammoniphilus resinae]
MQHPLTTLIIIVYQNRRENTLFLTMNKTGLLRVCFGHNDTKPISFKRFYAREGNSVLMIESIFKSIDLEGLE